MKDVSSVVAVMKFWLFEITTVCLILLLAATAVKATGLINITFLKSLGHVEILYLAGASYLLRK